MRPQRDPSEAEIRAACLRIQATWSPKQFLLRRLHLPAPAGEQLFSPDDIEEMGRWTPPEVALVDVMPVWQE